MANEFLNESENDKNNTEMNENYKNKKQKPRKRKIVKNNPLPVLIIICLVAFVSLIVWGLFFNQTISGSWYYTDVAEVVETYDEPESNDTAETADTVKERTVTYEERVSYKFNDDGTCSATVGTVTVPGSYYLTVDENGGSVLNVSIIYDYMAILYGSYPYKVEGDVFNGKQLVMYDTEGNELYRLDRGVGENPLEKFEDFEVDEKLFGEWRSDEVEAVYRFDKDGKMYLIADSGLEYEMAYTVVNVEVEDSSDTQSEYATILCKFVSQGEQAYSYSYKFDDEVLYLNGIELKKVK